MTTPGFLTASEVTLLTALAKSNKLEHRVARRANAMVLLHEGWSFEQVARALLMDDSTIRVWHAEYRLTGVEGLKAFQHKGGFARLTPEQEAALRDWVEETLPRTSGSVAQWLADELGVHFDSRSGIIKLLHRMGFEHRKPRAVPAKAEAQRQQAFMADYEALQSALDADEAVVFADAVHPTHNARPAGCWMPKGGMVGIDQNSGRQRLNIHGAIDLETGKTCMVEALTVDATSTIDLLAAIERSHPQKRRIHVFLDNARYHHARCVREWLERPNCRIQLHFIPPYCPHLNPIERLWGLMHRTLTYNRCYARFADFAKVILTFLRETVPQNWTRLCDHVSDNFRAIDPQKFRILA